MTVVLLRPVLTLDSLDFLSVVGLEVPSPGAASTLWCSSFNEGEDVSRQSVGELGQRNTKQKVRLSMEHHYFGESW
jgi:hypothetical protein